MWLGRWIWRRLGDLICVWQRYFFHILLTSIRELLIASLSRKCSCILPKKKGCILLHCFREMVEILIREKNCTKCCFLLYLNGIIEKIKFLVLITLKWKSYMCKYHQRLKSFVTHLNNLLFYWLSFLCIISSGQIYMDLAMMDDHIISHLCCVCVYI